VIKRVFLVPLNYSHRQEGQIQAFEQIFGWENVFSLFDYMAMHRRGMTNYEITKDFVASVLWFKPDWIWMQVQTSGIIEAWGIEEIKKELPKTLITHWMGDLRTEIPDHLQQICTATDATLVSNSGQQKMWKAAGAKHVEYVQIGLDWDADVLGYSRTVVADSNGYLQREQWIPPFDVPEVVFIGGYYENFPGHKERIAAIRRLQEEKIDVGVVSEGSWPDDIRRVGQCHVKQQHQVWKRAKVALSINNFNDVPMYYSDRQLIAMASGTPVVCRYVPGLEDEFRDDHDCLMFSTLDELVTSVRALLASEKYRQNIGTAGRLKVMRDHSWNRRILDLLWKAELWRDSL
jgi:glycosyltransferase involved in cell wall biosynthesis